MHLTASKQAQFFIQNEYFHVELKDDSIIVAAALLEDHIPFNVWNGRVNIEPGIFWGQLKFYSHSENSEQVVWLVQGLPLKKCREFARNAVAHYQKWYQNQCEQLEKYLPSWEEKLHEFEFQPAFLAHSRVHSFCEVVSTDLKKIDITLDEASRRIPSRLAPIVEWFRNCDENLVRRNELWMETELENWQVLFSQIESSPLNDSQRRAVLLNDDNNLVLAGAGSGKTSVLIARVAYLLQSHLAQSEELLMLAFGRDAAQEMKQRLSDKIGMATEGIKVNTFHQLGMHILQQVESEEIRISPLVTNSEQCDAWYTNWLKQHWGMPNNFKRWQKHLNKWPVAYLVGDEELAGQYSNTKLVQWLSSQVAQLCSLGVGKKELQKRLIEHPDYTRLNSELSLVWPCFQAWQNELKQGGYIDFNIMITKATSYVKKGKFHNPWRYIMIDEYQDISPQRLELIESLCKGVSKQPCVLFAVGDDWQSIYQFAGSDVDLTTGFSERFPHSTIHSLDTTYRFNNQIGAVANRFIQKNPFQLEKQLESHKQQKNKSVALINIAHVEKVLAKLNALEKGYEVLLLGRNHYHKPELLFEWSERFKFLSIGFMTCHASKGREADYVIVLNVDEGQFPAKVKALHLDNALSQNSDTFPYAEERRLFYVALTRAKKKVWLAYSAGGSSFIKELLEGDYPIIK